MVPRRGVSAIAAAGLVGLAACAAPSGQSTGGSTGGDNIGGAQSQVSDATAKGPAKEIPGAQKGGTITVLEESTPDTFDPTNIYYVDGFQIGKLTYRSLTQFDIRGGKPVLVPDLAEDLGTASADGLTWTFKIKKGIKYQDGTEVKAQDIAYAIKRSFAHDIYDAGPTYQLDYFKDADKYKGPYTSGDTYSGVETPDDNTLVIHLAKPFPDLPFFGAFTLFTPIPKAKDTKQNYDKSPMTTGPYMWQSYTAGQELKLVKNPNWDASTDPVRHQYVDGFHFKWGGDAVTAQKQVLLGQGQDATSMEVDAIDATVVPSVTPDKKSQLITGESPCTIVEQLDTRKIPLPVRKAIAMAYDWEGLNKVFGNTPISTQPASTILPPAVPGYTKFELPNLNGKGKGDPAAAKAALMSATGGKGFTLAWYYSNDSQTATKVSAFRQQMLEKAGFTVKPIGVPKAKLRSYTNKYDPAPNPINMLWSPRGWCSDWPSGSSWFPVLFKSSSIPAKNSIGQLSDPALDQKIDAISKLPIEEQPAKWGELDKYILETYLPALPFYYDKAAYLAGSKIGGAQNDPTQGLPIFTQLYVKQ